MKMNASQGWTATTKAGAGDAEVVTPTRPAGFVSDLVVPLGQALISGVLCAGVIVFLIDEFLPQWRVSGLRVWAVLALAIAGVAWVLLLRDTRRLLRVVEPWVGRDLDGDGRVGPGKDNLILLNAERSRREAAKVAEEEARVSRRSELGEFVSKLPAIGTDQRTWERRIGRERYQVYRDALLAMGWAAWNSERDKRRGWRLVLPVREILQRISSG